MKILILIGVVAIISVVMCLLIDLRHVESSTSSAVPAGPSRTASTAMAHPGTRGPNAMALRSIDRPSLVGERDRPGATGPAAADPPHATTGKEVNDRLETAFQADHPVAASRDAAREMGDHVRTALPAGSTLRQVECRSALCRIETEHLGVEEFHTFVEHAFLERTAPMAARPMIAALTAEPQAGEPVVAIAYVARDGAAMAMAMGASPVASDGP